MRARALLPLLALAACTGGDDTPVDTDADTDVGTRDVALTFAGEVDGASFDCRKRFEDVGLSRSSVRVTDLRFYVHDVVLIADDGSEHALTLDAAAPWQDDTLALVDLEDAAETCDAFGTSGTNDVVRGVAADLPYRGVRFTIGVPADRNHPDVADVPPLDVAPLYRSGTAGFWFFRTGFVTTGQPDGWPIWIGSTGCTATDGVASCTSENEVTFELPTLDPDVGTVVVDVGELAARADLEHNGAGGPAGGPAGCQSVVNDTDCQTSIFPAYGLSAVVPTFVHAR